MDRLDHRLDDGDGDGRNIGVGAAIVGFVSKAICAIEVSCGCIDE